MDFINIYVVMALVGIIAFIFIAESFNPFKPHKLKALRHRHWLGVIAGLLAGLSAFATKLFPANSLLGEVKVSFAAALLLLLPVLLYVLVRTFLRSPKRAHKHALADAKVGKHASANDGITAAKVEKEQPQATAAQATEQQQAKKAEKRVPGERELRANAARKQNMLDAVRDNNDATAATNTIDSEPSEADLFDSATDKRLEEEVLLTDQAPTPEVDDLAIGGPFPSTAQVFNDAPNAANSDYSLNMVKTVDGDQPVSEADIVADDLVDDSLVAWHSEKDDVQSAPADDNVSGYDDVNQRLAEAAQDEAEISDSIVTETPVVDQAEPAVSETVAVANADFDTSPLSHDSNVENAVESEIKNPDTAEIEQLTAAMDSVTEQADDLQVSVLKIQSLTEEETRYRAQLLNAQVAFENSQRLQIDEQNSRLVSTERQLEEYEIRNKRSTAELSQQRQNILTMQERVQDLELELSERQRIFADQVESLTKTKEMARHAAMLARKAATAQQKARTQALKERAARERLEVSAKKAVHIARNAISKLAEEERKNRNVQH